jgi:hypothetical protein
MDKIDPRCRALAKELLDDLGGEWADASLYERSCLEFAQEIQYVVDDWFAESGLERP